MKKYSQHHMHEVAPKEFRHTHDLTGHHELDVVIEKSKNGDMKRKLSDYLTHGEAYGPITGYSGYEGYRGDN